MITSPIFLCLILVMLSIFLPLTLLIYYSDKYKNQLKDDELFQTLEGNHIYYERSLIEKSRFIRKNPDISPDQLRTLSRFLKEFFNI